MKTSLTLRLVLAVFIAGCTPAGGASTPIEMTAVVSTVVAETPGPFPTAGPSPTREPPTPLPPLPSPGLSPTRLKYRVLEEFPDFFFCDPDFYPVAREDEMVLARQRFPEIQANQEEFQAILEQHGLSGLGTLSDQQILLIYREHKRLSAISFELAGDRYRFQIQTGVEGQQGAVVTGTIGGDGSIDVVQREPSFPTCPICLAKGTRIETPDGPIPVEELRAGSLVWTLNAAGQRVPAPVVETARVDVPAAHPILHVVLSDGREVWASPGHPAADGRALGALRVGDSLDGAAVTLLEMVAYRFPATYDLLPAGDTGFYWADGILLGSTLRQP